MCQMCTPISALASSTRWPKPLESSIANLNFLLTCIHSEHEEWKAKSNSKSDSNISQSDIDNGRKPLLSLLRDLSAILTSLGHGRTAWWKSKTPLIKQLNEEVSGTSERKLTELHKINNSATEKIEGMVAKLGVFVRWSLGLNGGVQELLEGEEADGRTWVKKGHGVLCLCLCLPSHAILNSTLQEAFLP